MKRLLVVDDDAGMRAALETRFRRRGWAVDVAVNGREALGKFRSGLHTLVITDVRMPGRDGFEVMREIQTSSPRTAVILLTAYGCVPEAVEAMRNGACDYAKFRIRGAILDSLRDLDWSPRELRRKGRLVESVYAQLSGRLGRAPTENELAGEMGLELRELQALLAELDGLELGSLHLDSSRDGRDEDLTEHLSGDPQDNPFTSCLRSELKGLLLQAISELPEKERQVLALYYYEELTMKEVGTVLGVGESRVSQIHSLAMVRLRARLNGLTAPHEPQGRARAAGAV